MMLLTKCEPFKGLSFKQIALAQRRTKFLMDGPAIRNLPMADLLANAWLQGVVDAVEITAALETPDAP